MTDNSPFDELHEQLKPQPMPWQNFEEEVATYVEEKIASLKLGVIPASSKVHRKPSYYSKIRESQITFDVAIEVFLSPQANTPTLIWLWECKDYPARKVTVDEVEEFYEKIRQVGAHKGTIVTRMGLQKGAFTVATSYHIDLLILQKEKQFYLALSQDAGILGSVEIATFSADASGEMTQGPNLGTFIEYELGQVEFT